MVIYRRYTGTQSGVSLVDKKSAISLGNLKKISITNGHVSAATRVILYIDDGLGGAQSIFEIAHTVIPPRTTLVLTDHLSYDFKKYTLKVSLLDAGYDITIIAK